MVAKWFKLKKKETTEPLQTKEEQVLEKFNVLLELIKTKKSFLARELGRVSDSQKRIKALSKQKKLNSEQIKIELSIVEQNIISSQGEDEAEIGEIDIKEQRLIREIEKLL